MRLIELHDPPASPGAHAPGQAPWRNRMIFGDNLAVSDALLAEFAGKVDLIYLDPPFATGDRFSLTAAVGEGTRAQAELLAYDDREDDPRVFLAALAPRLARARELLSPEGLLFVHLDARASHGAKLLLDELFGRGAFRGEIIWQPGNGAKSRRFFSLQHQTILAFSRGSRWTFNGDDPLAREPFAAGSLRNHFRNTDEAGRKFRRRVVNGKEYVYFADQGRRVGSVWGDIPAMVAGSPIVAESTGYPTQKPLRLLERIIASCSRPGDLVADLCFGSGTTLVAAERLGRRWIGCDVGRVAIHTARKRLLALRCPDPGGERQAAPFELLSMSKDQAPSLRVQASIEPPEERHDERSSRQPLVALRQVVVPPEGLPPSLAGRPWSDLIDAWSVGELRGEVFVHRWHVQRTRQQRLLTTTSPPLSINGPVAVKVYDVLGREGVEILPVKLFS